MAFERGLNRTESSARRRLRLVFRGCSRCRQVVVVCRMLLLLLLLLLWQPLLLLVCRWQRLLRWWCSWCAGKPVRWCTCTQPRSSCCYFIRVATSSACADAAARTCFPACIRWRGITTC